MEEKRFNCKMEDVPVVAGFVFESFEKDKADFVKYSPIFADPFLANGQAKQTECYGMIKSGDVLKQQKAVKDQIDARLGDLRVSLNQVEGYLKLAAGTLDINDFGLKTIRAAISNDNVEKTIVEGRSLIANLKRNEAALKAKGMSDDHLSTLTTVVNTIDELNTGHNTKKNERSRASGNSIKTFNELWDLTGTILDAARAMYRGVDEVKLKEYTLASLLKRVHNSQTPATDKPDTEPKK
ncbi:MAG: hypothetical protein H6Q17_1306 [Bacteroidetes bacterium]|nr:hypothetical protein [Bacteroidota bacterium]